MHTFTFAALLAGLPSVLGDCFTGGADWGTQKAFALDKAMESCTLKFAIDRYNPNDFLATCYNLDSTKKVDFVLARISTEVGEIQLDVKECYDGFQKEVNGCENGGVSSYTNWKYT